MASSLSKNEFSDERVGLSPTFAFLVPKTSPWWPIEWVRFCEALFDEFKCRLYAVVEKDFSEVVELLKADQIPVKVFLGTDFPTTVVNVANYLIEPTAFKDWPEPRTVFLRTQEKIKRTLWGTK